MVLKICRDSYYVWWRSTVDRTEGNQGVFS